MIGPGAHLLKACDSIKKGSSLQHTRHGESVWLESQQPEKMFLQGLIQVTAAFHHLQRNNPLGTALLLKAALERLERYPAHFGGISVDVLCDDIREWLQALEAGTPVLQLSSARISVDLSS